MALLVVLSVAAVGCQKETVVDSHAGIEASCPVYTVRYAINGITHTETLIGEQAWAEFLQRMMALAEEGYRVSISRNTNTVQNADSKEVVTFVTKDLEAATLWVKEKVNEGFEVTVIFNQETGEYTCIAVR